MSKAAACRATACVVMYGGAEETHACLESLSRHSAADTRIYLVDNASPDGALETLEGLGVPDRVQVLAQDVNRGFGAGHNVVLPLLDSEYHAVVNPDILLYDDAIGRMCDWLDAHPDVAIATPHLQFPDGRDQFTPKRRPALLPLIGRQIPLPFLKGFERHYLMLDEDLAQVQDVEFCSGSFFVIRTAVFEKIGGFDEGYFMYVEDADITQKALREGRAVYLPDVVVAHAWHRAPHTELKKFLWQLKSMLRYFKKWGFKLR